MNEARNIHDGLVAAAKSYVAETLHAPLELQPWPEAHALPRYLTSAYFMLQGDLGGRRTLWLFAHDEPTPAAVEKNLFAIAERWPGAQVVVFDRLPSYARRRLIENGISFVVPSTQLYLPQHGLDFRSRSRQSIQVRDALRPSAQAMFLYLLLHSDDLGHARSASDLAPILGQSLMTASRAVAELKAHGLVSTQKVGRTKEVRLRKGARELWETAQDWLRTPVLRRLMLLGEPSIFSGDCFPAGVSALSRQTMLAEPHTPTFAVSRKTARELADRTCPRSRGRPLMAEEAESSTVEVWSYDPGPLSEGGVVDPLSLVLSFRDDPDERVQGTLRRLLEGLPW
ncbi:MAG: winged helix-turn-helix domain-containing protein [Actinobacteria bacterium]|nr:winged helix-turn-helix domain-containing protein [Actinomycetota bacterium]